MNGRKRDRARGHDQPRRDDRRHRSRSRSPAERDDYARRRSRSPRRRSPSPRTRRRPYSRSASPADRREQDRHERKRRDSRSPSPSRERRRDRGGDRDKDGERRRRTRSRSSSGSEDSEEERERERRHKRKKDKHRKRSRSRSREKDRDKDKDRKEKKKKSKKDKKVRVVSCCIEFWGSNTLRCVGQKQKSGAVGHHQWGKYGIINESDLYNKEQEFRAWLVEERKINPETITKDQTKKEFARFAEDYNTATLPHEKFYNMDEYERRMSALRAGEYVPPADDGYDPTADMRAHASTHKRRVVEHESYMNKEQLMELRKVQNERIQAGKMKLLGMDIKQNMGVRMDGTMFDG
ncbi:hypothetical protein V8D89_008459 [Ganoderma adspersum]